MPPAAKKAPFDFLFAFAVSVFVIATSFAVKPDTTKYVVMITGIVMLISVAAAAARPDKPARPSGRGRQGSSHS